MDGMNNNKDFYLKCGPRWIEGGPSARKNRLIAEMAVDGKGWVRWPRFPHDSNESDRRM